MAIHLLDKSVITPDNVTQNSDVQGMAAAWSDSLPAMQSRWPASAGGAAAVFAMTAKQWFIYFASPTKMVIIYDDPVVVLNAAGFLAITVDGLNVSVDLLAIQLANNLTASRNRLKRMATATLTGLANNVPANATIFARFPIVPANDQNILSTMQTYLDAMTVKNGVQPVPVNGFNTYTLTPAQVLQGLP